MESEKSCPCCYTMYTVQKPSTIVSGTSNREMLRVLSDGACCSHTLNKWMQKGQHNRPVSVRYPVAVTDNSNNTH